MFRWTAIAIHWRFSKTLINFLSKISHRPAQQNQNLMIMLIETWIQWYIFRRRLFQIHFRDTKSCILMWISLKFVPMVPIDKQSSLFHLNQFTDAFVWFRWIILFYLRTGITSFTLSHQFNLAYGVKVRTPRIVILKLKYHIGLEFYTLMQTLRPFYSH